MKHEVHPAALSEEDLLSQCEITRTRRSGPGGQHRNKVESAVVIKHLPTGIRAEANERRSQAENRRNAILRLRITLAVECHDDSASDREPSSLWKSRCASDRIEVNPQHDDYPALLTEALGILRAADFDVKKAAEVLQVSATQLVKFLKTDSRAIQQVNDDRAERGLRRLR